MASKTLSHVPWSRFHDFRGTPLRSNVDNVICADDAVDLIAICRQRPAGGRKLKAAGSHWSLSDSTVSEDDALETNWPGPEQVVRNSGLARDFQELISDKLFDRLASRPPIPPDRATDDPSLGDGPSSAFPIHLKSGTRIYEAYQLIDRMDRFPTGLARALNDKLKASLNAGAYDGPWAFATLGGAGGQTVFGALTTGTHGGDYRQRPIADAVLAMHLIVDGGNHYWIEPASQRFDVPLTDDGKLQAAFAHLDANVRFEIVRDNDVFNAVLVGVGRFGVVSSFVIGVVPQYCLLEHRVLDNWSAVKIFLNSPGQHRFFDDAYFTGPAASANKTAFAQRFGTAATSRNRFLQIAISLSPHLNGDHRCGVTQRWFHPNTMPEARDPAGQIRGRAERGGDKTVGNSSAYAPPTASGEPSGTFITKACGEGNFLAGVARQLASEVEQVIATNAIPAGGMIAAALAVGAGAVAGVVVTACTALAAIALALKGLADWLDSMGDVSLAQALDVAIKVISKMPNADDNFKIMTLRTLFLGAFESLQAPQDYVAISYAVMDGHDYLDRSCFGNAESIEVFFDADRPDRYCAFIDAVLAFEAAQQEQFFRFSAGYISLRYMRGSKALIAPAQFANTVALEISGLRDAAGSLPYIANAEALARNPMFGAHFHWGQRNPLKRAEVEQLYDVAPDRRLSRWRRALGRLNPDGKLDGFSSAFTQRTGLEP